MGEPTSERARSPVDPEVARDLGLDSRGTVRRWAWRAAGLVALVALAAGGAVLWQRARAPRPVEYRTAAASRGDVRAVVEATGTVQPVRTVQVGPDVSGRVVSVHADFNDVVEVGQLLVEIDPLPFRARQAEARARVAAARATLRQARASLAEAARTRERFEHLSGTGAIAERDLDAARSAVEQGEAAVMSAQAQVALAQASLDSTATDLERTIVRSPVAGVVLERRVEPGQAVAAQFQPPVLFVIAEDLDRMELHLAIDEADIGRVEPGQRATFTVDAHPDHPFEASVREVRNAPTTVQGVVTYEAVLDVDNAARLLRPGMTASANVSVAVSQDVLRVPSAALRFTPPGRDAAESSVWVLRDGAPVAVRVERGLTDGAHTEVRGALAPDEPVLVDVVRAEE